LNSILLLTRQYPQVDHRFFKIALIVSLFFEMSALVFIVMLGKLWFVIALFGGLFVLFSSIEYPEVALCLCIFMLYSQVSSTFQAGLFKVVAAYAIGILMLTLIHQGEKLVYSRVNMLVLAFTTIAMASLFYVDSVLNAFQALDRYFKALVVFILAANLLKTKRAFQTCFWAIILSAGYLAGWNLLNLIKNPLVFFQRTRGLFEDPNTLAMVLVSATPFCYALIRIEKRKILKFLAFLLGLAISVAIIPTLSRGGILAATVVFFCILYKERKNRTLIWTAALGLMFFSGVFYYKFGFGFEFIFDRISNLDRSILQRYRILKGGLAMFLDNPVLGVGVGNFVNYSMQYTHITIPRYAHNMFLHVAGELGIPGLTLFTGVLGYCMLSLNRAQKIALQLKDKKLHYTASAIQLTLIGFTISGMFLSKQFDKIMWLNMGMSVSIAWLSKDLENQKSLSTNSD